MKGSLRDWGADMGKITLKQLEGMSPDVVISRRAYNNLDIPQEDCIAKAGWRLAVLLNNIYK